MKVVAVVPAKGTSERVENKNFRVVGGEYLFKRKLRQLLECETVDEVWLDTDSDFMINQISDLNVKVLKRDPKYADNSTDGHSMYQNEALNIQADILIQALCTSPFLDSQEIDAAVRTLLESNNNSLVAVKKERQYTWSAGKPNYGWEKIPNSRELDETTIESMSLYIVKNPSSNYSKRYTRDPILFETSQLANLDLDYEDDIRLANEILKGRRADEQNYFKVVKSRLHSTVLSDITKELGITCMLPRSIKCVTQGKILGRAKTLKIRALRQTDAPEEWKGIYKALDSYAFIENGDVITVENNHGERAYFGDLNCHLALRAGASGVIVNGLTRDTKKVSEMGLPVFATGIWSNDIKYDGTLESMNHPIRIGDCTISNGDIIYADEEGAMAIPANAWPEVLTRALEAVETENRIRESIISGTDIDEIITTYGHF
jgi:regulator of RNase E activity RraA/CMP-N-acetylneuraminic acid synthetase